MESSSSYSANVSNRISFVNLTTRGQHITMYDEEKVCLINTIGCDVINDHWYLCGKVITELEPLEKGRHDNRGKEKNDTPEEDVRDVGAVGTARTASKLPTLFNTILQNRLTSN